MKILNSSPDKEESIGDYTLQQNLNGHSVTVFKFPPKVRMKAHSAVTVSTIKRRRSDTIAVDQEGFTFGGPGPKTTPRVRPNGLSSRKA